MAFSPFYSVKMNPAIKVALLRRTLGLHHFWAKNPKLETKSYGQMAPFCPNMIDLKMRPCKIFEKI